ncbi:MAG: hypothetical protein ACLR8U_04480 [Oscillospiraceae bacterium]
MDLKSSLTLHVNFGMLEEEAECMAYLRGAFLAGGSVTDPTKRYHLEMTTSHCKVSRETCALLIECGFSPKGADARRQQYFIFQAERLHRGLFNGHRRAGVGHGRYGSEGRKGPAKRGQPPRQLRDGELD